MDEPDQWVRDQLGDPCDSPDERGWWLGPGFLLRRLKEVSRLQRCACDGLTRGGGEPNEYHVLGRAHSSDHEV